MRTPENSDQTKAKPDSLLERQQRTQKERSEQALSNLGSQDRKRPPSKISHDTPLERGNDDT